MLRRPLTVVAPTASEALAELDAAEARQAASVGASGRGGPRAEVGDLGALSRLDNLRSRIGFDPIADARGGRK